MQTQSKMRRITRINQSTSMFQLALPCTILMVYSEELQHGCRVILGFLLFLVWGWTTVMFQLSAFYCKGFLLIILFMSPVSIQAIRAHKSSVKSVYCKSFPTLIHCPKLTWNLKRIPLKRIVVCKGPLFRFHVCLAECSLQACCISRATLGSLLLQFAM